MRFQRYLHAAAAASLAAAAPLFAQDTTGTASGTVADSGRPLPRHRPTVVFDSATLRRLPVDDVRQVPVLVHGVYGLTDSRAFSVRGGLNGDAAVYVDGALIRNGQRLDAELLPPVRGVRSMAVTTGLAPAYLSGVQAGLLEIETPTGGEKWSAGVRYRADEAGLDLWGNVGFHRIEATVGGALPLGLTGFAAFVLDGQRSLETEKLRDVQAPVYIASGTDTIIRQPVDFGNPNSDTIDLAIPRFMQYSGSCDESSNGGPCHGLQVPFSTRGAHVFQAKIQKSYGGGSDQHVNLTVLAGRQQARDFPFTQLYNPTNRTATRTSSSVFILDWLHRLPGPRLALNVNVSYQRDERAAGVLTPESEAESFRPSGGFLWSPLKFVTDMSTTHDVTIAGTAHNGVGYLDDIQINCLLAGQAACTDLVPFLDRNDLISAQPYRMNPYATEQSLRLPFFTSGLDGPFDLSREHRWQGRLSLAWRSAASNTMFAGVEFARFDTRRYAASSMISAFAIDAYAEQPRQTGAYFVDQAQFGDFEITAGIRIDRFDSRALYPIVPGRISSVTDPFVVILPADTVPLAPFDPLNPTANFRPAGAHSIVSPQIQFRFDAWPGGTVRFTVGRQSRPPSFESLFAHKNTDLSQANFTTTFGRDIAPVQAEIFELGAHAEFGDDRNTFADVALYSHDLMSEQVTLEGFKDPGSGNVLNPFRVFTTESRGKVKGIDAIVGRQFSNVVTASVTVSHQSGAFPDGARTFGAGSVVVRWGNQAPLGAVFANTDISSILRLATNRKYTPQTNAGSGSTIDQGGTFPTGPENVAQLPMFKTLDIRITRTFPMGRLGGAVFVESTNLLNWTNFTDIFTETGEATNPSYRARWVDEQVAQLETEAQSEGLLIVSGGESAVDLRSPGVCQGWGARASNGAGGPADCVLLQRAEQRFGNSDGLFTHSEYSASFGAWYDLENAPYRFYGPGRRIRLGVELSF